jgi:glutamate racemase
MGDNQLQSMNRAAATPAAAACIGVFDSGIGGLSVLRELYAALPSTSMRYLADSGHAPYGERGDAYVVERSVRIANHLVQQGAALLVVACNTATAAAVQTLRETWPALPVVGVEPGIKPAVAQTRNGRIGVMATPGTLASDKFQRLIQSEARHARLTLQPCPGLAALIEAGDFDAPALTSAIQAFCAPLKQAEVDTVVLGCTHYGFARQSIQRALGGNVVLVDTAEAIARRVSQLWTQDKAEPGAARTITLQTTGEITTLRRIATALLTEPFVVEESPAL